MAIAMTLFANYDRYGKEERLQTIKDYYDEISQFNINLPTPILCGARTPLRQYSSCVLIDVGDSMDSIIHSDGAITKYTSQRAGIGINAGRIRAVHSKIRGGEVVHTGVIPFLKKFEASVKSCTQNGVRGGSATTHFPFWHREMEDIVVLKNNKGTEDSRVRKLDYSIQVNSTFYKRVAKNETITLFSPNDVPDLYDNMGTDNFEELYEVAERRIGISTKKVNARDLFSEIIKERIETGRIYIMNMDNVNKHSSFTVPIRMSNLCQEITLPTTPITDYHDPDGEIALCILSAINLGNIDMDNLHEQMERRTNLAIRALDEIVDLQEYPIVAAMKSTISRRSLGVGFIGLAHFLAKNKIKFCSQQATDIMHTVTESFQYHLIKASNNLAKEVGPCSAFHETKYSKGILPIDTYSKTVDDICSVPLQLDWEELRASVLEHGLRNSTLSAQMPSESSSVTSNETNGVEVPRTALTVKKSKKGLLKLVVPEYRKYKEYYQFAWDEDYSNKSYTEMMGVVQKFFDQAISLNDYWDPSRYPRNEIPIKDVMRDLMYRAKLGAKTAYYLNTYDGKSDEEVIEDESDCASGACAI
jgi:ribonucleoside-diphosphate reductase alpha chain